jgi:alpha-tubulin suppressor-like RCC1 family protein
MLPAAPAFAQGSTRAMLAAPSPAQLGRSVIMTAEVDALSRGAPTGSVTFFDGPTPLGSVTLSTLGAGQATLAAGAKHSCALTNLGGVKCWGYNGQGQLGNGTTTASATPVQVVGLESGIVAVATGVAHSCALTKAGEVKCWGDNYYGELGIPRDPNHSFLSLTPQTVPGLPSGVVAIVAGLLHNCALLADGGAMCWGGNQYGQLGNGSSGLSSPPTRVGGPATVYRTLAAGYAHSCGVTKAGAALCWGMNSFGQLGDGTSVSHLLPTSVAGLSSGVVAVTAGVLHTCAITTSHALRCWGRNSTGQLGDGTKTSRLLPTQVVGLTRGVVAAAAAEEFTCALMSAGGVQCWGMNRSGQLGDETTFNRFTPAPVHLDGVAVALSASVEHSCVVLSPSRSVTCWGDNLYSQLGDGTATDRLRPVAASNVTAMLRARARLSWTAFAAGDHQLRACYPGDADHSASTSAVLPLLVK